MSRPVHFEIHASDPESLATFYRDVFGWKVDKWSGDWEYWVIDTGDAATRGINGGMVQRQGDKPTEGQAVSGFVCTMGVADIDATVGKATSLGATIALPKMAVPGVGLLAYVKDPDGNIMGILQPEMAAA
jgi:predicted enzyme related to lactoylglutathione lyase